MFGIMVATIFGLFGYVLGNRNFYECYLSATLFLFWWSVGAGISLFFVRRMIPGIISAIFKILPLTETTRGTVFRQEIIFCFFTSLSVGAAYLLHSSLEAAGGLCRWDSSRLVWGISMCCVIVSANYIHVDFRKARL